MGQLFGIDNDMDWLDLGNGVRRKLMSHNEQLMVVKVRFEQGAVGEPHAHPHVQISYVSSGKFSYSIAGEERILVVGDTCIVPPNVLHGCVCLEAGELIDSFTPSRTDFLDTR
ncbi:cupin domain-containing protein [Sphingobacterium deserti]|uniref:Cupin 2 conserved barrel domain protein n=1 Tax=Sphingobacterium deserti TaxID=1229276 RepID=A0A0B8T9X0_9SPHI|nr:cupin domain-containing protein [Sphingobacterium deserti]KGE15569.1 cupin 2 conserved barrel domain protein [Sphingobacterium deserti]